MPRLRKSKCERTIGGRTVLVGPAARNISDKDLGRLMYGFEVMAAAMAQPTPEEGRRVLRALRPAWADEYKPARKKRRRRKNVKARDGG